MREWVKKLDDFLRLNDREVLTGLGKISSQLAKEKVEREFAEFDKERRRLADEQAAEEFAREAAELEKRTKQLPEPPPED